MPGGYSASRPHGEAEWAGGDGLPNVVRDCLQCAHCSCHFFVTPGSGKRRGFCTRCAQVTCGAEACDACLHWRQKLENKEKGRPLDYKPIVVSPGGVILG